MGRIVTVVLVLIAIIAVPFLFRPKQESIGNVDDTLVIVSPHNEAIRYEFTKAFQHYWQQKHGRTVHIDWRTPGGTSEIARFLGAEFRASFQYHWEKELGRKWTSEVEAAFDNRKVELDDTPADDTPAEAARRAFLNSDVSSRIDLFFGGGSYDFGVQAQAGRLVDAGLQTSDPDLFDKDSIPAEVGGEIYYDPKGRWYGTCLSAFGICYNVDALERLGVAEPPTQWIHLSEPDYFRQIALADPTKSGSAAKAFEMLIQQQMQQRHNAGMPTGQAITAGWNEGMRIIRRISANARYFTDSATKIPIDVSLGDAAAGMCIDFYGRFQSEADRLEDGTSRLQYLTPEGGSSIGVDPIGLLRGAPHRETALEFIRFVLSLEGQKLWNFKIGTPGGTERYALRRLPIRKELYDPQYTEFRSDPEVDAYAEAEKFTYHPEWTGRLFNSIRFIVRVMALDAHDELREAWQALIENDFPPKATELFDNVSFVNYEAATGVIQQALNAKDKTEEVKFARTLGESIRGKYLEVIELANNKQ